MFQNLCRIMHQQSSTFSLLITKKSISALILSLSSSWYLVVQNQKWKHQNNMWNLFQVNNKEIEQTSITSFFTHCFDASIVNFEQVNARREDPEIHPWPDKTLSSQILWLRLVLYAVRMIVGCCRRIVWVCLTILWGWCLKG